MLPPRDQLRICFAHGAYQLGDRFVARDTGIAHVQVRDAAGLARHLPESQVLVVSMLWKSELAGIAPQLKFIQAISSGTDFFDRDVLRTRGIRLASAAGANANAVAEHAMALILALRRHLPSARDNQKMQRWRPTISHIAAREDELAGKTLLIIGLGRAGMRLARLAKAFDMRVIATRRNPDQGAGVADAVYADSRLGEVIGSADVVALTCPLTPDTLGLIDANMLARMKPSAHLVNVARGRVVDEDALILALEQKRLAAAGIDVTRDEPLPQASPLWAMPNVLLTPHTAGETQRYEDAVIDLLLENLGRLWRGETALRNQVV
jgi:D-2-hydroxyacid dehydrogenase (NADP+)